MRRVLAGAVAVAVAAVGLSCRDVALPTAPAPLAASHVPYPGSCPSIAELKDLAITALGSGSPNVRSVLSKLDNMQHHISNDDFAEVRKRAFETASFIIEKNGQNAFPSQSATAQLLAGLFCYLGAPSVNLTNPADVWIIGPDPDSEPDTLVTSSGDAGVVIPDGAVDETTIITITPVSYDPANPNAGPLNTKLDQYPGYFAFNKFSESNSNSFLVDVIVAVCPVSSVPGIVRERLRLGHNRASAASGFEITPPADASFLECDPPVTQQALFSTAAADGAAAFNIFFAGGGVGGTAGEFSVFGPVDPLVMLGGGVGGTAGEFMRFNVITLDSCTQTGVGTAVEEECRPTATISTLLGTELEGVPITFTVVQGGGSIALETATGCGPFAQSVVVPTNSSGRARICWTMGSTPGMNEVNATPAIGGDVPAEASFTPESRSFEMEAVVLDNTPPVVTYTGNSGTYTVDQRVTITCSAADEPGGSGLGSTTCADLDTDAYLLPVGPRTLSATATDNAGNVGYGETTFTVVVTGGSLCAVITRTVSNAGVANSLCAKLPGDRASPGRSQVRLNAFLAEISAQNGKFVPAVVAPHLVRLAQALFDQGITPH